MAPGVAEVSPETYLRGLGAIQFPDSTGRRPTTSSLAGHNDWRLPTIKELYSLIDFDGSSFTLTPYIDTAYFDFRFGDPSLGERVIDAQYWSSTQSVGTTMNNDPTVFGVNFADGRIKGYPRDTGAGNTPMQQFVRCVRGNSTYGVNQFPGIISHRPSRAWRR